MVGEARDDPAEPDEFLDDREVAEQILARDEGAAARFFAENNDRLYNFVLSRCRDPQDAEEVTQATWVTAVERMGTFQGDSSLLTWVCGIARYKLADLYRTRKKSSRRTQVEEFEQAFDVLIRQQGQTGASSGKSSPTAMEERDGVLSQLQQQEVLVALRATLALLPEDYQRALCLKYMEGLSVRSIARELGRGEKAVESLLTRAKREFRRLFTIESGDKIAAEKRRQGPRGRRPPADGGA